MSTGSDRILAYLFPAALAWALLIVFAEELFAWMPQEYCTLLEPLVALGVTALSILGTIAVRRRWPGFLIIAPSRSAAWTLGRLLLFIPLVFVILAALIGGAWVLLVRPHEDRTNPQYGLSAWFAALFYSAALTPLGAIVLAWLTCRRPAPGSTPDRGDST